MPSVEVQRNATFPDWRHPTTTEPSADVAFETPANPRRTMPPSEVQRNASPSRRGIEAEALRPTAVEPSAETAVAQLVWKGSSPPTFPRPVKPGSALALSAMLQAATRLDATTIGRADKVNECACMKRPVYARPRRAGAKLARGAAQEGVGFGDRTAISGVPPRPGFRSIFSPSLARATRLAGSRSTAKPYSYSAREAHSSPAIDFGDSL